MNWSSHHAPGAHDSGARYPDRLERTWFSSLSLSPEVRRPKVRHVTSRGSDNQFRAKQCSWVQSTGTTCAVVEAKRRARGRARAECCVREKMWRGERVQTGSTGRVSARKRTQSERNSRTTPQARPDASFSSLGNAGKRARASPTIYTILLCLVVEERERENGRDPVSGVPTWLVMTSC